MKFFAKFLLGFFLFYILLVVLLYFKQNSLVYYPPKLDGIDIAPLAKFKKQSVVTADNLIISGYYLAPQKNMPLIIEFHGNASHPAWEAPKFNDLMKQGYGVFLAEYRGYGDNQGVSNENNLYRDAQAYLNWARDNPNLKHNPIILYGASLGSGVAVDAASKTSYIAALILEVPFNKLSLVGAYHYPYIPFAQKLMTNKFYSDEKIKNVKVPILIMVGRQDNIVPMQFGQSLFEAANQPKRIHVFEQAGHLDVYQFGAAKVVEDFLKEYIHD